jgi:divalent metal cation (Fe/Co/Zn/Cd) transporter
VLEQIRAEIEQTQGVDRLLDLMTMYLGPDRLIVAARVDFGGDISADRAEEIADEIDKRLADRLPQASHVFLDPTQRHTTAHQAAEAASQRDRR